MCESVASLEGGALGEGPEVGLGEDVVRVGCNAAPNVERPGIEEGVMSRADCNGTGYINLNL